MTLSTDISLAVFGFIHDLQTQITWDLNPNLQRKIESIATLCNDYYGYAIIPASLCADVSPPSTTAESGYYTPQSDTKCSEENQNRPRGRSISLHYGHGTQHSTVMQVDVGCQLNELYDDVMTTATNTTHTIAPLTKIYEDMGNGKKEYIDDLGDLIEVLDENDDQNVLHLYLETNMKQSQSLSNLPMTDMNSGYSDSKSELSETKWALQQTPRGQQSIDCFCVSEDESESYSSDSGVETPATPQLTMTENVMFDINPEYSELEKYGYRIMSTIEDTLHGCVYLGEIIASANGDTVAIKKVEKNSCDVNDKGLKEAVIAHYLTKLNKSPSNNVCQFIEFIETESNYYLIEEYCGAMTLEEYVRLAHEYILDKKLKIKDWQTVVKYILWQLTVTLHWLHFDMRVCHLDLTMDNIMIQNGDFVTNKKDGMIAIDTNNLNVKVIDFDYSEIFSNNSFKCQKQGLTKDYVHKAPKVFNGEVFDAQKSDMFSLGTVLYAMCIGKHLYSSEYEDGYIALKTGKIQQYLQENGLGMYVRKGALKMIEDLLQQMEEQRMDVTQVMHCEWFKRYWAQYKTQILKKSKLQRARHVRQASKLKHLPYYKL